MPEARAVKRTATWLLLGSMLGAALALITLATADGELRLIGWVLFLLVAPLAPIAAATALGWSQPAKAIVSACAVEFPAPRRLALYAGFVCLSWAAASALALISAFLFEMPREGAAFCIGLVGAPYFTFAGFGLLREALPPSRRLRVDERGVHSSRLPASIPWADIESLELVRPWWLMTPVLRIRRRSHTGARRLRMPVIFGYTPQIAQTLQRLAARYAVA